MSHPALLPLKECEKREAHKVCFELNHAAPTGSPQAAGASGPHKLKYPRASDPRASPDQPNHSATQKETYEPSL